MAKVIEEYLSQLHREHLKPRGFTKVGHTFSRQRDSFTERFQVQGSAWNDSSQPWRFYLNVGVAFPDLPPRLPDRDFPATHCWARVDAIVTGAPSHFELQPGERDILTASLCGYIDDADERLSAAVETICHNYQRTSTPWLSLA